MPGLLVGGKLIEVPGLTVISPGDQSWCAMSPLDYATRETSWVRQITIHTTKGDWPQTILPGKGVGGRAKQVADYWRFGGGSKEYGGAALVVDSDGTVACLIDLLKYAAHHATRVNPYSIGIEMYQEGSNAIYDAVLESTVKLVLALCDIFGIPLQGSGRIYRENGILQRLKEGGKDVVGVYGHRDNAWDFVHNTSTRGKGDPGEEIWIRLNRAGKMNFDIDAGEELVYWKAVQRALNEKHGQTLTVDGVCGPGTVNALRKLGLWNHGVFLEKPIV